MKTILYDILQNSQNKNSNKFYKFKIKKIEPKTPFQKIDCSRNSSFILYKLARSIRKINDLTQKLDNILLSDIDSVDISEINANPYFNTNKYNTLFAPKTNIIFKKPTKPNKYLFKGNVLIAEKIKKTKIKAFSLSPHKKKEREIDKKIIPINPIINESKNQTHRNRTTFFTPNISKNDCFFITKLPYAHSGAKTTYDLEHKKLKRIIKQSNKSMFDIYTGLKNIHDNCNNNYFYLDNKNNKENKNNENNMQSVKCKSANYINKKFRKLFQKMYKTKKYSNEKMDARKIMEPLEEICGGYKEIKLDNTANNKIGKRIWIKKSTANMLSYGKSFQLISDNIFYKERRRIIGIYPKIEQACDIKLPYKKIHKINPNIVKIQENLSKMNSVYSNKYKLLQRVYSKYH